MHEKEAHDYCTQKGDHGAPVRLSAVMLSHLTTEIKNMTASYPAPRPGNHRDRSRTGFPLWPGEGIQPNQQISFNTNNKNLPSKEVEWGGAERRSLRRQIQHIFRDLVIAEKKWSL